MGEKQPFQTSGMLFSSWKLFGIHLWGPLVTLEGGWEELATLFGAFQTYKARTLNAQYEPGKNSCSLVSQ